MVRRKAPRKPLLLGGEAQLPDILQNLPKCWLRGTTHGSICIQEGQPDRAPLTAESKDQKSRLGI